MYKEYPRFIASEVLEYDRKSRFDDPYLSVEEILEKHDRIIDFSEDEDRSEYSDESIRKYLYGKIRRKDNECKRTVVLPYKACQIR